MSTIDPRLRYLLKSNETLGPETVERLGISAEALDAPAPVAEVLLRLRDGEDETREEAVAAVKGAGGRVTAVIPGPYTVLCAELPLESVKPVGEHAAVNRVEASRPLTSEMDLCVPDVRANLAHAADPAVRGHGTVVAVIDTGIDFNHRDFLDGDDNTRIRLLWDQDADPVPGSAVPFGREYTREQIDAALKGEAPPEDFPPVDPDGHGTHVCGIAAGGGRASAEHLGIAPDAELIVVSLSTAGAPTLGRSQRALQAFSYVVERAAGAPVAINFSQGMNGGGHSGETVLETGLDNLARRPGVAIVKSAGNEQQMRIHAGGTLAANQTRELRLEVLTNDRADDIIEVWFDDADDVSIAVAPPSGSPTAFVARGGEDDFNTQAGNAVRIALDDDAEETGDTVATIILSRGTANMIQPGTWRLLLRAGAIASGQFDAWIERANRRLPGEQTRFVEASNDPTRTISIPGTARNIITVGSYVTRPEQPPDAPVGAISLFSSRGPTRYGQLKPEIVAPGQVTQAARLGSQAVVGNRGTSMAAPVVTGAAALILSQRPDLTCVQLKQVLARTSRRTGAAAVAPDSTWGHGRLDVQGALDLAGQVRFPIISNVRVEGAAISWETDVETTGAVRFLGNRRQLLLGKNTRSLVDLNPSRSHRVSLASEPAGLYFCQIVAFSADNFFTEEDDRGRCFVVDTSGTAPPESALASSEEAGVGVTATAATPESAPAGRHPARVASKKRTPHSAKKGRKKKPGKKE